MGIGRVKPGSCSLASKFTWIDINETYGRHVIHNFLGQISPYTEICDLGAGSGNDLSISKTICPTAKTFAVECFPPSIKNLEQQDHYCLPLNIEIDSLPFTDESLDVIMANQVFEHIKELFWVMHESTRCLKIGGHLIVGFPNIAALHNRLLLLFGRHPTSCKSYSAHVRCFSKYDFLNFLQVCFSGGYKLKSFAGSQFYPFPKYISRILSKCFPNCAQTIFFLLQKTKHYDYEFIKHPIEARLETNFYLGDK